MLVFLWPIKLEYSPCLETFPIAFFQMYYSEKGAYKRGSGGQTITFENSAIVVHAHMEGSTYHPLLNVSVIPQVPYKLAPLVWKRLYKNDRARYTGAAPSARSAATAGPTSLITSAYIVWWLWNRTFLAALLPHSSPVLSKLS